MIAAMKPFSVALLLSGTAYAAPQALDWKAIELAGIVQPVSIPVVHAAATEIQLPANPAADVASVSAAVLASPQDTNLKARGIAEGNEQCSAQPTEDDTATQFLNTVSFRNAANSAQTPDGYYLSYGNKQASSQGVMGYMGYSVLNTYDVAECSRRCNDLKGCQSVNIYFERDPSTQPTATCTNPPSETVIKCVYYGAPIKSDSATNDGQWNKDFHVVIAGSNAYVNSSIATPSGYTEPVLLNKAAINAPNDCNGGSTYMTVKIFSGNFDLAKCAAACSAQSEYNRAHPDMDGTFQTCQFINTYVLYNQTTAVGQYCALYNETWPATFATNHGQWRDDSWFNLDYSYMSSNTTGGVDRPSNCANPGAPQ